MLNIKVFKADEELRASQHLTNRSCCGVFLICNGSAIKRFMEKKLNTECIPVCCIYMHQQGVNYQNWSRDFGGVLLKPFMLYFCAVVGHTILGSISGTRLSETIRCFGRLNLGSFHQCGCNFNHLQLPLVADLV